MPVNYKVVGEMFGDGPWVPVSQMKQKAVSGDSCQHSSPTSPVTPASAEPDSRQAIPSTSFTASVNVSQLASGDTYPRRTPFWYNVTLEFSPLNNRRLLITMRDMVVYKIPVLSQVKKRKVCSL